MSASESSASSWSGLLSHRQTSEDATATSLHSETDFHREFKTLCFELRERDPQRLLAKFLRHHAQIIAFIGTIEESVGREASGDLSSVFWPVAFQTVRTALRRNKKDQFFSEYFPRLNGIFPAFGANLPTFPNLRKVQRPLQNIFTVYMDCYQTMLADIDPKAFFEKIESASREINKSKAEWESLVEEAKKELEVSKSLASSQPSPNGKVGPGEIRSANIAFEKLELLGRGTYGEVYKVREASTGTFYAQKDIRVMSSRPKSQVQKAVINEVSIMQRLRYHHIASVPFYFFQEDVFSIIMLPVADCDLLQFLQNCVEEDFPETELHHLTSWFGCLVGALAFAHGNHIKHEDIKPSNILIKGDQPYLADFGCAIDFSGQDNSASKATLTFGTPVYWPPEGPPRGQSGDANPAGHGDVFSLGCVFTEMLTVKYGKSLEAYQQFRHVRGHDNGYAFRENLPKVTDWLNGLVTDRKDRVGNVLKDQIFRMIEPDVVLRDEAKSVKRALLYILEHVFCTTCC